MPYLHGVRGPIVFVLFVVLASIGVFVYVSEHSTNELNVGLRPEVSQDVSYQEEAYKNTHLDLGTYLSVHISELSPVQEVLGGKFYVTDVEARDNKGTVTYSDGHTQYIADFIYTELPSGGYSITKFKVR